MKKMKHTDFYGIFKTIRHHIVDEIKAAVKAHGGEYSWEEIGECPIVAANPDTCEPEPLDVCIWSIKLGTDDEITIKATGKEYGEDYDYLSLDDIFVEHLGFIIDYMDDVPEVSDVSIPFNN